MVNKSLFRAYDIRGPVEPGSIDASLAFDIGRAIGEDQAKIIVGRDGRLSSPEISTALINGLLATGCTVIDIGIVPTPLVYYATNKLATNSGIMVTGRHNPKNHNGFKIVINGATISTDGIQNIYQKIISQQSKYGVGEVIHENINNSYIEEITKNIKLQTKFKLVIDCGNGATSDMAPKLYRALGCDVTELYCKIDGNFPNHHPDPSDPTNLQDLINKVQEIGADLGLAFDGDGDRVGVVTNKGEIIWSDRLMMLLSQDLLSRKPGAKILFDVKCSSNLSKIIKKYNGEPIMYCTGHSLIKRKMREIDALLAGEMSGHIFFKENWFGFDDGMYTGARLLNILDRNPASIDEIFKKIPNSINTPELKIPMLDAEKFEFLDKLAKTANFSSAKIITIDGLRVEFEYGWGLVRASNTTPCLVLRFEADTHANLKKIQNLFKIQLLSINSGIELPF